MLDFSYTGGLNNIRRFGILTLNHHITRNFKDILGFFKRHKQLMYYRFELFKPIHPHKFLTKL